MATAVQQVMATVPAAAGVGGCGGGGWMVRRRRVIGMVVVVEWAVERRIEAHVRRQG